MKSDMTAEAFVELHGPALLQWLQTNTVECACTTPFGPDENLQRGTIDLTTSIACRRCYVPLGLHDVRLPRGEPQPGPDTERPPPPLRSPAFAQILDHGSGLGLSIDSVAAADSDWAKLKYGGGLSCSMRRRRRRQRLQHHAHRWTKAWHTVVHCTSKSHQLRVALKDHLTGACLLYTSDAADE